MKKATILLPVMLVAVGALSSCSSKNQNDPKTLNVVLYNAGWGDEWFKDIITKWESENEGYKVNLTSKYEVNTLINRRLASSKNTDDLYIATDNSWKNYAAQGAFAPLDDLMDEKVDGVKVRDKVNDEFERTLDFTDAKGNTHVYRLPWTACMGGIYYNAKMFEENGWTVPTTTAELTALVNNIIENPVEVKGDDTRAVKPFVYTGENTDYFDYTVFNWWLQTSGYEKVREFYNYSSAENFNYQTAGSAYEGLYKVVKYWRSLFGSANNVVPGSLSYGNHQAQQDFFNGKAAMMFNGDWMYNETLNYGEPKNFELKLMKTPTFEGAVETDSAYVIGSDQYIAVPATSTKQDLAKSFLKVLMSNWSLSNFTNKSHGFLAYKNTDQSDIDRTNTYVDSYLTVRNSITKTTTDASEASIYLDGSLNNCWVKHATRPFLPLLQDSAKTVEECFDALYANAKSVFASSK